MIEIDILHLRTNEIQDSRLKSYYPKKQGVIAVGTMEIKPEKPPVEPEKPPVESETPPTEPTQPPNEPPTQPDTPPAENKPEDINPQVQK